jgi:type I restriction enzyme S subunit
LKEEKLLAMRVPLPPIAEQRALAAQIEDVAAKLERMRGLRHEGACNLRGVVEAEERRLWPSENMSSAPTLEEVTVYLARGRQAEQGLSDHFLIKTQHVQSGRYVRTNLRLSAEAAARVSADAIVRPGDVLIACSAAGCLGRVAFYDDTGRKISTDTHVAIARANPDVVLPEYLYAYLRGAQGQFQLRSRERGDWTREKVGFRLTELNLSDLRRAPVPVLAFPEQRLVVAHLRELQSRIDAITTLQSETDSEMSAFMPALLDKAFRSGV